jgi:hypothetical protein
LGSRTKGELEIELGQPTRTGVSLFKILYMTSDVHGSPDTASGLLVIPEIYLHATRPIVIYQHGTTNGPPDAPSRLASGSDEALAYGSMGYITLAADYLGLGDNDGFHPYVHARSQALAGLDMFFAVIEFIDQMNKDVWVGDLFVSGYSQGGHAAAALQKELEENWSLVYPVTASTPMSGPYSISGVMYNRIIGEEIYYLPAYIAYVTLAYQEAYGNLYDDLNDIFKPAYVPIIESFRDHNITTALMNILLTNQIFLEIGVSKPKIMFKDSVLQEIIANENHPFRIALRDNDLYDWAPQAPTRLYYCTADEQVPYQNSIVADSAMNANGAPDIAAINFGAFSHGGCAPLAIEASIEFFDSFILSSGTDQTPPEQVKTFVYPNPASNELIFLPEFSDGVSELKITGLSGTPIFHCTGIDRTDIDISTLASGVYIVHARADNIYYRQKIVIINQ